jgi:hypothetical protein
MTQSRSSDATWASTIKSQQDFAKGAADARSGGNR